MLRLFEVSSDLEEEFAFEVTARTMCRSNFSFEQSFLYPRVNLNQVKLEFFVFFEKNFGIVRSFGILGNL